MNWINTKVSRFEMRDTDYNRSVCMTQRSVNNMISRFDTIFDSFVNFTNEIASLTLYPMLIKPYVQGNTLTNYLKTTRGSFIDTVAYRISWYAYYQTLGEYFVSKKFNNFADYKGYTQIKLFLPFLGYVDIDTNECMGKFLQFRLLTDFNSGKGLYIIGVSDTSISHIEPPYVQDGEDDDIRVIYTFECDLGVDIPLGKSDVGNIKRNILLGAVKTAVGAGIAAYTSQLPISTTTTTTDTAINISSRAAEKGSRLKPTTVGTVHKEKTSTSYSPRSKVKPISEAVNGSIDVLNNLQISGHSDRVGDAGLLYQMSLKIQVIIYRPKFVDIGSDYGHLYGYPLGEVKTLSEISGYTEINTTHLEGQGFSTITNTEIAMLENALSSGIIL